MVKYQSNATCHSAHARWCAIAIFQPTEHQIKANPPCFARARAHVRALMTRKSCAVEMRNAILRNYLNYDVTQHHLYTEDRNKVSVHTVVKGEIY